MTKFSYFILVVLCLYLKPALADHTANTNVSRLKQSSDRLYSEVYYSTLRYEVKQSVYRFTQDVNYLHRCVLSFPPALLRSDSQDDHTGNIPYACQSALYRVRSSFYPVERYLYDTQYDYPYVYRQYRQTRYALSLVH